MTGYNSDRANHELLLGDSEKEWYQRENASPFSIEYKACVEGNDPSFDPFKSMEKKTQRTGHIDELFMQRV